jgi:hypothetical protein
MMGSERLATPRTLGLLAVVLLMGLVSCSRQPASKSGDVTQCLRGYHAATPDPMPADGLASSFALGATYATPCGALSPSGEMRWTVLVVAPDDKTIRAYFIGGRLQDRCGLLRDVTVNENSSAVTVHPESGSDTAAKLCTAAGERYVTEFTLSKPLAGRALSGPNTQGIVEHLK